MTQALAGMFAVVTGASSGIGRAIALELAAQGVGVWLIARHAAALGATADDVRRGGGQAWSHPLDLSSDTNREGVQLHDRLLTECAGLDILVHSAGTHSAGPVADAPVAELDEHYRVNVRGPYMLTQVLLPLLRARRGQIVFVNSSAGLHARAGLAGYAASKYALRAVADALRDEVNADGVRVLSVYPGRTATPRQEAIHAEEGKPYRPERLIQPEDVASVVVHALTVKRTAEVTDISIRPMQKP
jgi:NADP-dependent 3-hydroxy acid dehydrogenase YdfG